MDQTSQLEELLKQEPWRQGDGQPRNAIDPTWEPGPGDSLCTGEVEYEPGSRYWVCQSCGYVGSATSHKHKRAEDPFLFLRKAISFYLKRHGYSDTSMQRMAFVAGVAIRYAAVTKNFREYVAEMVIR